MKLKNKILLLVFAILLSFSIIQTVNCINLKKINQDNQDNNINQTETISVMDVATIKNYKGYTVLYLKDNNYTSFKKAFMKTCSSV